MYYQRVYQWISLRGKQVWRRVPSWKMAATVAILPVHADMVTAAGGWLDIINGCSKEILRERAINMMEEGTQEAEEAGAKLMLAAATAGDTDAMLNVGVYYYFGRHGFERSASQAVVWTMKAAEQGMPKAMYHMAIFCEEGVEGLGGVKEARQWLERAADKRYLPAYSKLGGYYMNGRGGDMDLTGAVACFGKAAELGEADAQYLLASCLWMGRGIEQDREMAFSWYAKAAEAGSLDAQRDYGIFLVTMSGDDDTKQQEGIKWLKKAYYRGNAAAAHALSILYFEGKVVLQDMEKGRDLLIFSATQGEVRAVNMLADCYTEGMFGFPIDRREAQYWIDRSVALKNAEGYFRKGKLLLDGEYLGDNGQELIKDERAAMAYLQIAAQEGHPEAQYWLGTLYMSGIGMEKNPEEGIKWLRSAAEADHAQAQYSLGLCYVFGEGVERDEQLGLSFLEKSARHQHAPAVEWLQKYKKPKN